MGYVTELHCHTGEVSRCADVASDVTADIYAKAGYNTVFVMNHLNRFTFGEKNFVRYKKASPLWEDKIEFFLSGPEILEKYAAGRFNVLWGAELRFNADAANDYLVYGIDADFLYSNPDLLDLDLKTARERIHEAGGLIYQAHPFRTKMVVQKPSNLDGIEAYNGHMGHDSKNDIALLWAKKFGLPMISGSDYHHDYHVPSGGIVTDEPITSSKQLVDILKSGNYTALRLGEYPEGGKHDSCN